MEKHKESCVKNVNITEKRENMVWAPESNPNLKSPMQDQLVIIRIACTKCSYDNDSQTSSRSHKPYHEDISKTLCINCNKKKTQNT